LSRGAGCRDERGPGKVPGASRNGMLPTKAREAGGPAPLAGGKHPVPDAGPQSAQGVVPTRPDFSLWAWDLGLKGGSPWPPQRVKADPMVAQGTEDPQGGAHVGLGRGGTGPGCQGVRPGKLEKLVFHFVDCSAGPARTRCPMGTPHWRQLPLKMYFLELRF
jgi:hypothetical protein